MFKKETMHLSVSIFSAISSAFTLLWLSFALAHLRLGLHIFAILWLVACWIITSILAIKAYRVTPAKYKKLNWFGILIAPLFIPIFTSFNLYKNSGVDKKIVDKTIEEWETKHIFDYLKYYDTINGVNFSKDFIEEISITKNLYKNKIIDKKSMRQYIRRILMEELKIEKLPIIYTNEQIKVELPE
ncbi:hypothetical protein MYMA111404_00205 [Mycoplasma marinum]|uniref:Uncharacterized protein n=1 Tax=Mycoplasma marinum TaxID=1937190 RepID=A0A4R0XQ78_9MOLU|nr:hypothetical protein [Mycoplasma marinum]TCG11725.1 hypothetical protein C4B24_01055 [Mycoplasma marinum]